MSVSTDNHSAIEQKYKLVKQLAIEEDGVVYLASTGKDMTKFHRLKKLFSHVELGAEELLELTQLLGTLRKLHESGCVTIHDLLCCPETKAYYILSEQAFGYDLPLLFHEEALNQAGFLGMIRSILLALLKTLSISSNGGREPLAHGDICPEKIILQKDNHCKLLDFGMREMLMQFYKANPAEVSFLGLCHHWEQSEGRSNRVDRDRLAVGLLLFEGLTGYSLSHQDAYNKLNRFGIEPELPEISAIAPDLSPGLVSLLQSATHPDPHRRFQSHEEFLACLENTLATLSEQALFPSIPDWDDELALDRVRSCHLHLTRFIPIVGESENNQPDFWETIPSELFVESGSSLEQLSYSRELASVSAEALQRSNFSVLWEDSHHEDTVTRELPAVSLVEPETLV